MPRVKRGVPHLKRRRRVLARTKGFRGSIGNVWKVAKTADTKAGMHAYRDRRVKKRTTRALWQIRINAGLRALGTRYSVFMGKMKKKQVGLNRKVLSELAASQGEIFKKVVEFVG